MHILIIRRDNIGDLVCTTPLIGALRQRFPHGWLGALVNSYNAPVLEGNPDLDEVFVYTKAKHRSAGESLAAILWRSGLVLFSGCAGAGKCGPMGRSCASRGRRLRRPAAGH